MRWLGHFEYLFGPLRDIVLLCVAVSVPGLWRVPLLFLVVASHWRRRKVGQEMTALVKAQPLVHPEDFFATYYARLGFAPAPVLREVDPRGVDFRRDSRRKSALLLVRGVYDTAVFARCAQRDPSAFDAMATLWGSRIAQLFECELSARGVEQLRGVEGKLIIAANHKSHLDFVFMFFALARAGLRPRFVAAKDHFVDNVVVRDWIGIGKLIAAVDMVFVDRKRGGMQAMTEAAKVLCSKPVAIAIFPQGTRAPAIYRDGERADAGYLPLKRGAAVLALETRKHLPVQIACVGITGTAAVVPKGEVLPQTGHSVHFEVGALLAVSPDESVDALTARIDAGLRQALPTVEYGCSEAHDRSTGRTGHRAVAQRRL